MSLRVVHPGAYSLIVDGGRPDRRHRGLPLGGAADRAAWMIGNALVGNVPDAAAIEVSLAGPTLTAGADTGLCLFGAPFQVRRDSAAVEPGTTFTLNAGETLQIGGTPAGARAYLCVAGGGVQAPIMGGSRSSLSPLEPNQCVDCPSSPIPSRSLGAIGTIGTAEVLGCELPAGDIRVVPGPQADWFDSDALAGAFRVTPASNRMGVRLEGGPLDRRPGELVSEAVAPGAVQVTNDGQCIVLGVDGQTIGGYPKVAHVIRADLDRVAQLRPGDRVRLLAVTLAEAEAISAAAHLQLQKLIRRLHTAGWPVAVARS